MLKIFIETLGCKINQYESSCILDDFLNAGFRKSDSMVSADIIILNTCTVTNRTDYKSRNLINKAKEIKSLNSEIKIIVTGCYSQRNKNELLSSSCIDYIIDNNDKNMIFEYIKNNVKPEEISFSDITEFENFNEMKMNDMGERSRAFLKIQDGCDFFCSYCAVPFARGKPRSRSLKNILNQTELLLSHDYQEIVLSGINLGLYNYTENDNTFNLADILFEIAKFDKLKKIRLSSIEPQLFTKKLLTSINEIEKICPHFHIPLQSGSDSLLKLHGRRYSTEEFKLLVQKLEQIKPLTALGFDVIVGLPGETDELFQETYDLLKSIDFTYLHVFIYSKRKGTKAANMKNQVHGTIAKNRSRLLIELANLKRNEYINRLIKTNTPLFVIPESFDKKTNLWSGTSDRFIKAYFNLKNETKNFIKFYPKSYFNDGVEGDIVND